MTSWLVAVAAVLVAAVLAWQLARRSAQLRAMQQAAAWTERELRAEIEGATELRDSVLKAVDDALLVLDPQRVIVYANPAADALLGKSLIGETLLTAILQPELETLIEDAQRLHGESLERRVEFGRQVLHARAVASENEHSGHEVLTLRDVTELQRLERARREMVSNITHELSTPITSISLLADTLMSVAARGKIKRAGKMAKDIRRETETLTHLVQEIRDLARIESGQMPVRMTPTDLAEIVRASVDPLMTLAESKQQSIGVDVGDNVIVLADEPQIQRALKNIVHNAIKYTPERGSIRIAAAVNGHEAVVSVADDGQGIPAEDLTRIFERFFQVDRSRREGTGLGLAIVRHIVEAHGGRTWVESVEGEGATFFLTLALADSPDDAGESEG